MGKRKRKRGTPQYERIGIVELNDVIELLYKDETKIDIFGYTISLKSLRYKCFLNSGTDCVSCGVKGDFFAAERTFATSETPHLNLYAVDKFGKEILMTKDHIVPKARGGSNTVENLQTMCLHCNQKKGDTLPK